MEFGKNLKKIRKRKKLKQSEVGKLIGVTRQTVQKYESGVISNVPLDKIEKLATALNCNTSDLLFGTNEMLSNTETDFSEEGTKKLKSLMKKDTISSLELLEQINFFRKKEGKPLTTHRDLLIIIETEFTDINRKRIKGGMCPETHTEIKEQLQAEGIEISEYSNSQNGQTYTMYLLPIEKAKQCLLKESKYVRRAVIHYIEELENKISEKIILKANLFSDDKDIVIASHKRLLELETEEKNKLIEDQRKEIEHNQDVIIGLVKDVDLKDKRAILNEVVRYRGANIRERWRLLYKEFEGKFHLNIKARLENYKQTHKVKSTFNKLDYIEKELKLLNELYEIACKIFKSDIDEIIARYKII